MRSTLELGLALLLVGASAYAEEPNSASYYCAAEAAGGLRYDSGSGKWTGASFPTSSRFVLKLVFNRAYTRKFTYIEEKVDEYRVSIADDASRNSLPCLSVSDTDAQDAVAVVNNVFHCSTLSQNYEFNLNINRYFDIYDFGYINGSNTADASPMITGGTCTRIDVEGRN